MSERIDTTIPESQSPVLTNAVNEVVKEKPRVRLNLRELIERTSQRFIQDKLNDFSRMCLVFRVQNKIKLDELRAQGDEAGWSETKNFKFDYEIPTELYMFMINLVYRDFWKEENEKVWRPFLRSLMKGYDPIETLMKVKAIYGSTKAAEKAGIV